MNTITEAEKSSILHIASSFDVLQEIKHFRACIYQHIYPSINIFQDSYDNTAIVFFKKNADGNICSTARMVLDSSQGLPSDIYFPHKVRQWRQQGKKLVELGRFIIQNQDKNHLKLYYKTFYISAKMISVDYILMAMKTKDIRFHQRIINAEVLNPDIGVSFGGKHRLSCMAWNITKTPPRFFRWVDCPLYDNVSPFLKSKVLRNEL